MSIVLPTFEVREKLTAEKLNAFRDAIEAKFAGGITPADWSWPFVVQGNIDFAGIYSIVGLKTFWNLINVQEYINAGGTFQTAMDAAQSAGGGCLVIPPDTTIETNGINITGSLITIMGFGPSSVLKLSSGSSSGYYLRSVTGGITDISILNLALDGQNTGTAQAGVIARRITRFLMDTIWIKNFSGFAVQITHDGTPGNSSAQAVLRNINFSGGTSASGTHLKVEDCDGLMVIGLRSDSAPAAAVLMEPTGAAGIIRDLTLDDWLIKGAAGKGLSILGASATADAKWSDYDLSNIRVRASASAADSFELGNTNKILQNLNVVDCFAPSSTAGGFTVNAKYGLMSGCMARAAATYACKLMVSELFSVKGCMFQSATTFGIDASNTINCTLTDNEVQNAGTQGIICTAATNLRLHNNAGYLSPTGSNSFVDPSSNGRTATGFFTQTKLIPAGTLRTGDVMRITAHFSGGTATTTIRAVTALGQSLGGGNTDAQDNTFTWIIGAQPLASPSPTVMTQVRDTGTIETSRVDPNIDWTIDQTIKFEVTAIAAGTVTLWRYYVEMFGSA